MTPDCAACAFAVRAPLTRGEGTYDCHALPPTAAGFPHVYAGQWCGQFRPAEPLPGVPKTLVVDTLTTRSDTIEAEAARVAPARDTSDAPIPAAASKLPKVRAQAPQKKQRAGAQAKGRPK